MKYILIALICVVSYCNLYGQNYNNEVHISSNYYIKPDAITTTDNALHPSFSLDRSDIYTIGFGYSFNLYKKYFLGIELDKDIIKKRFTTYLDTGEKAREAEITVLKRGIFVSKQFKIKRLFFINSSIGYYVIDGGINEKFNYDNVDYKFRALPMFHSSPTLISINFGVRRVLLKRMFIELNYVFDKTIRGDTSFETYYGDDFYLNRLSKTNYLFEFTYLQSVNIKIGCNFNFKKNN
jgi:hypothetical protein